MRETTAMALVGIAVILLIFGTALITENNQHECRMEAMKALTDPSRIKEICG